MGYLHIPNLYKDQRVMLFRCCFALEKVHGTSAHVSWRDGQLGFSAGGASHEQFVKLFDQEAMTSAFQRLGYPDVVVYGEAYGGKLQGMRETYGPDLRFIVFDVSVGASWLSVPDMNQVATGLGFEVVPYREVSTDIQELDRERDRPSDVAVRRGIQEPKPREGVVLRPLVEVRTNNGERVIAKHKGPEFEERRNPPKVQDSARLAVARDATAIAQEWVTDMRLSHVLDRFPGANIEQTREVILAMVEDVYREAKGEVLESQAASKAIGARTAQLFKQRLRAAIGSV